MYLPFNLYAGLKWLTHHHISVLEYSEFDLYLPFSSVLHIFMLLISILPL